MSPGTTIKKINSFLLICLFALSITPKIIIHDLIADHRDSSFNFQAFKGSLFTKAGLNCHFENLVAESPFLADIRRVEFNAPLPALISFTNLVKEFYCLHYFYSELRGPPSRSFFFTSI